MILKEIWPLALQCTDPESHSVTDRRTDRRMIWWCQ